MSDHIHLTDHELVLALDGEVPLRRRAAVEAHLDGCASCQARRTKLDHAVRLAASSYRTTLVDPDQMNGSRASLRRRLAAMADPRPTLVTTPFEWAALRLPRWAPLGAAVLATLLLAAVVHQHESDRASMQGAIEAGALPIAALTPGATWNVTVAELCASDSHEQHEVSSAIRAEVLRNYRMEQVPAADYELDYLITPALGGAPAVQNLWPQRFSSQAWNARVKDQLEELLPQMVCEGRLSLQTAQRDIAVDWVAAYKKYFRTDAPREARASPDEPATHAGGAIRLMAFVPARKP